MSVLSYLQGRSSAAVLSSDEKSSISTSVSTLRTRLDAYFTSNPVTHFTFGSYTRETILPRSMDAHSDVDYMVTFSDNGYQPQTYLDRLRRFVESKYLRSEVYQSSPTIVLELNHIKFELVPSIITWGRYQIPDGSGSWQKTNPNDFNAALTTKNQEAGYQLKPVIRLAKYWNANAGYVFGSYLFEKWIVEQYYYGCSNQKDYLFAVFDKVGVPTDTQWRVDKVKRAKEIIGNVRIYEAAAGYESNALVEIKKLVPE